jgi:hypothetical protein
MAEAVTGNASPANRKAPSSGFEAERVARFLQRNAQALETSSPLPADADAIRQATSRRLHELAMEMRGASPLPLDELDRTLTVLEERLLAALLNVCPEKEIVAMREQADRELAPYRGRMSVLQIRQVQAQFLQKRMLDANRLPRLSLFYMGHE